MFLERMLSDFEGFVICDYGVRRGFTTPQSGNSLENSTFLDLQKLNNPTFSQSIGVTAKGIHRTGILCVQIAGKGRVAKLNVEP